MKVSRRPAARGFIGSNLVDALRRARRRRGRRRQPVDRQAGQPESRPPTSATIDIVGRFRGAGVGAFTAGKSSFTPRPWRASSDRSRIRSAPTTTNVTGTLRVLKAAVDAGVRRVVYSSSSSVYGDQPTLPLTEDMPTESAQSVRLPEADGRDLCAQLRAHFGLETVCLRYFNVYGPRQVMEGAYRLVIGIFMDQRAPGEPLTIHGDGEQTRDFTWVGDVVRANMLAGDVGPCRRGRADQRRRRNRRSRSIASPS